MIDVIFMGTPEIAVKSLQALIDNPDFNVIAVVTQPDRPKNRGKKLSLPPVKVCALDNNIPVFQTESIRKDDALIAKLRELKPDFFVTFAFGQILSGEVLDIPKFCTVNLHASLLPEYRGANPIQRCIYNGDTTTGITTMITVLELDAGDICENCEIEITQDMNDIELKDIIAEKSPKLICSTLRGLYDKSLIPVKQKECGISVAKKFTKEDALIDWTRSSKNIHDMIRSMVASPTAYTFFNGKSVKIIGSSVCETKPDGKAPGEVVCCDKNGITVCTGEGCICLTKLKPESKGEMRAYDFANGARIVPGMKFGEEK